MLWNIAEYFGILRNIVVYCRILIFDSACWSRMATSTSVDVTGIFEIAFVLAAENSDEF